MMKPFQIVGAQFLAERTRALLADEPGVGKTAQAIHACELVGARRVLVVCPAVGIAHWRREFARWSNAMLADDNVISYHVISYDKARDSYIDPDAVWDVLIVDESHYAKNPRARRAHAIFGKGGLGWHANRIWCMSGTPAPNNAAELYPMLRAFGATGMTYDDFAGYFCRVDTTGKIRGTRGDHVEELRGMMKSYVLRRKKRDVLPELGEIDIQPWYVEPSPRFLTEMEQLYDAPEAHVQEEGLRAALAGKSTEELLAYLAGDQEFATLRRYNALLKVPAVCDTVLFEIENGLLDKVVIYGYHKEPLERLEDAFNREGIGAALLNGDTPQKRRDGLVQEWKRPHGPRVMIASIISAGVVLDFSNAHQGIMLEEDWVPGNNLQAMQRMHRHGQENPVTVRVAIGSAVDEVVSDVVLRKTKELSQLFA